MSSPLLILRQVNESVRNALLRFRPELQHCSAIPPGEFSSLLAELLRARKFLSGLNTNSCPASTEPDEAAALADEMREYHANLEKLKHILPDVQIRLLAEKSRLQRAQSHVIAASAWAGASKKTL